MGYIPFNMEQINLSQGSYIPSTIKPYNNIAYEFWQRSLFQRAASVISIEGFPEDWKSENGLLDFFYYILFKYGYLAVTELPEYGLIFNPATLSGKMNLYYQPTEVIISNPVFKGSSKALKIGDTCELVKLTPDYRGIWDIISYYAEKLALNDCAVNTSLINSKIPYILGAKTKSAAEGIKRILDKIHSGETAAVYDTRIQDDAQSKTTPFQMMKLFTASDFITDKLLETHATLLNAFDTEIGIQTLPYNKKERMVQSEAESKSEESIARATVWLRTLNDSFEAVNKHYGTNLSAKLTFKKEDGNVEGNDLRTGEISFSQE